MIAGKTSGKLQAKTHGSRFKVQNPGPETRDPRPEDLILKTHNLKLKTDFMISGRTRILGIFGDPVAHSLSPAMQNEALRQAGIDMVYVPFRVRRGELGAAVGAVRALDLLGVNVTIPHKEEIFPFLDEIDLEARLIGAVNTVINRQGKLIGFNTDAVGFLHSLREDLAFDPAGKRILLIGAGGACRAALAVLGREGAAWIGTANRTLSRSEKLAKEFGTIFPGTAFAVIDQDENFLGSILPTVDLVVNTTSLGLKGETLEFLDLERLPAGAGVYDMVYARNGTPLTRAAADLGLRTADGKGMLAGQGEESFFLWTGEKPPPGVMKRQLGKNER